VTATLGFDPSSLLGLERPEFDRAWKKLSPKVRAAWWLWFEEEHSTPWRATPSTMSCHLAPGLWKPYKYWMLLGQKFRDAVTGVSPRQLWAVPPRLGKSSLASRWGPAWSLDRDPTQKIILVSYGDDLADENARSVRDILVEHSSVLRAQLRPDVKRRDRFMTEQGGGIVGAGIGSALTGFGATGVCLDDPFKSWVEAHSEAQRDRVDFAYRAVVRTRLEDDNPWQILPATRWHEDDLTGRLLDRMQDGTGEEWELVRIPAIAERYDPESIDPWTRMRDPLGRAEGEVIEPEKFSIEFERERARSLGSFLSAALLQQRPAPAEGGEFKRSWWQIESTMPEKYQQMLSSWDMKLKERDSGDFTVGQVWGRIGKDCWLVDQFRGRWTQATTACAMALVTVRHPECRRHLVESAGYGPEVMQALRTASPGYVVSDDIAAQLGMTTDERDAVSRIRSRGLAGLIPVTPKGSKVVRARAIIPYVEAGDVHLPSRAPWLPEFLEELSAFPQGNHDDMCLPAGTQIVMPDGPVSIEAVTPGDQVLGASGWVTVEDAGQTGISPVLDQFGLRATAKHPFATDRGWIPFRELRHDDMLWTCDVSTQDVTEKRWRRVYAIDAGSVVRLVPRHETPHASAGCLVAAGAGRSPAGIANFTIPGSVVMATPSLSKPLSAGVSESSLSSSVASRTGAIPTLPRWPTAGTTSLAVNGSSKGSRRFTKRYGKRATGRSPRAGTSIIGTKISATIGQRIWNVFHGVSTRTSILLSVLRPDDLRSISPSLRASGRSPWRGTSRPKAENGTGNMPRLLERLSASGPLIAHRITNTPRRTHGGVRLAVANARNATVYESVSHTTDASEPVFNLRTSDGTYFADGVLVHNCDTLSQALAKIHNLGVHKTRTFGEEMRATTTGSRMAG